jgi:hypothetical protein
MEKYKLFIISILSLLVVSCSKDSETDVANISTPLVGTHEEASDYTWDANSELAITLNGTSISSSASGVSISGTVATITAAGTYRITGTLTDGQIVVNTEDTAIVRLILNGVTIGNTTSAPINIVKAEKAMIVLADNTQNSVSDAVTYVYPSADVDEPNAAIFSKTDLTIFGNGTLNVTANYNDGITSKDGLIVKSGNVNITSVDDGIRGKDYLVVKSGTLNVNAKGDALKSDNEEDASRGYIAIEDGNFTVISGGDAISAQTNITIKAGELNLTSGGGSGAAISESLSAKAIKGLSSVVIDGGSITVNSADDAVHSNGTVTINGGTLTLASGDDGMHANTSLTINGGTIDITKSYEGIESAAITVNDGTIHLKSSDDGFNAAGGTANSLVLKGSYVYVNADGDGLDANGSMEMTGGVVLVNGPTNSGNGPLDYDSSFKISGGYLVAVGSSGMSMVPSTTSSQYSVLINFTSSQSANNMIHIQAADGSDILTFVPAKTYQSVVISCPALQKDATYDVYLGGSSTGDYLDGLYKNGVYTPGTLYTNLTISTISTTIGSSGGMGGGGGPRF